MTVTIAEAQAAVATALPDREAVVHGVRRLTYAQVTEQARRLANLLLLRGITCQRERGELENWQCGQDRVALYIHNCPDYLISMLGCFQARAVPFNVNYRYVGEELAYLFGDAEPKAVIYEARFAPTLAAVLESAPSIELLIQIEDGSGEALLLGALDFARALAASSSDRPNVQPSPDDIYCTYTGGTTGMPKGVLWRQEESMIANLDGRGRDGAPLRTVDEFAARAEKTSAHRSLAASPFMHGAGIQVAMAAWLAGNTVIIQDKVDRLDADDLLATVERERVDMLLIIGDAFGRPLLAAARSGGYDLSSLRLMYNSGAILSAPVKLGFLELMPELRILDALGSSETGPQAISLTKAGGAPPSDAQFKIIGDAVVLSEDLTGVLQPGHAGFGWLAKKGAVPLGYLGDAERTAKTFPVIDGERYVNGGDRVQLGPEGALSFHGRESFTINSGGEKIFAEEVEQAIKQHGDVADVVVTGRPSARWGSEVVAIVEPRPGVVLDRESLLIEAARHVARYKLPKAILFVERVQRSASGKTDARWARELAGEAPGEKS
jgi:acyl-CoA synthetase (AMP-forming)/AMP-acid ligase II